MRREQFRQWGCRHQIVHARQRNALEHRSNVAAAMGGVHEGVKQVAFGMLLVAIMVIHAMRTCIGHFTVAHLVQITHSRQHRGRQHGQYKQQQRR